MPRSSDCAPGSTRSRRGEERRRRPVWQCSLCLAVQRITPACPMLTACSMCRVQGQNDSAASSLKTSNRSLRSGNASPLPPELRVQLHDWLNDHGYREVRTQPAPELPPCALGQRRRLLWCSLAAVR